MKARFSHALKYKIDVTCCTPFRTGDASNSHQEVLLRWDGKPILQGTSLIGSFRAWRDDQRLFGTTAQEGELIVSELVFSDVSIEMRPRLAIDGDNGVVQTENTGARKNGKKFDVAALPTGTKGTFTLIWKGDRPCETVAPVIEQYLSALHSGLIQLGAQRTNGYGRVSLEVKRSMFDLYQEEQRTLWLADAEPTTAISLAEIADDTRVCFDVTGTMESVLVKASTGENVGGNRVDAVNMTDNGQLIIPGSSIKGALRAQAIRIAHFMTGDPAMEMIDSVFGYETKGENTGKAGLVRVSDGSIERNADVVQRIRIDRLTAGTIHKGMFNERPAVGKVHWTVTVPKGQAAGCALILFALRDLGLGFYTLGSENNIGRGRFSELHADIRSGNTRATLDCKPGKAELTDRDGLTNGWIRAIQTGGDDE